MPPFTLAQILVAVRYGLAMGGTYAGTLFPPGSYEQFSAFVVAGITFAYALWTNRPSAVVDRAAETPGVIRVVAERELALAAPSAKVVPPSLARI